MPVPEARHRLSFRHAARAMFQNGVDLLCLVLFALAIGIAIYYWAAHLPWTDAFLNASMILGGMGPVDPLRSSAAKIFASFYALFSGLAFIGVASLIIAPFAHRLLHRFHIQSE